MKFLRPHIGWLSICTLAIALLVGRASLVHMAGDEAVQELAEVEAARAKTESDLNQLREDVATARKLSSEIDRAHAEVVLAPVDRLKAAIAFEKEAADDKIAHFTYTLAPEEHTTVETGGTAQNLATSAVSLCGDAPSDVSVYAFIEHAQRFLPGRARLQQLKITREGKELRSTGNVHFEVTLEWLSNGSLQTVAGNP